MWYTTKDGKLVFNTKADDGHIYQLTNEHPLLGEYCLASLESDPLHVIKVKTFDKNKCYALNDEYDYGINFIRSDSSFYGVGKIVWTSNPNLQKRCEIDIRKQEEYWGNH